MEPWTRHLKKGKKHDTFLNVSFSALMNKRSTYQTKIERVYQKNDLKKGEN